MIVYVGRNDGNSDHISALINDVPDIFILNTNHILSVNLQQVVINQKTISGSWGIHGNGSDFALLELEPDMSRRILRCQEDWVSKLNNMILYLPYAK